MRQEEEESSDDFGNHDMGNQNPITHLFSNDSDQQTDLPLAEPDEKECEDLFDFNPSEFLGSGSHPD